MGISTERAKILTSLYFTIIIWKGDESNFVTIYLNIHLRSCFHKREGNKIRKRKNIQILTRSLFAYFNDFTSKITANDGSRLGKTKMNMFPICRILRSMGYFDQ
jgi:hypothetical protein